MTMESNKDEALRCIAIAEKYIKDNNKEKAEKFLQKAERLFPTQKAQNLLLQTKLLAPNIETEQPRKRKISAKMEEAPKEPEYSVEQHEAVVRIKKCKDYYEILGITKDATDTEIKKAYKKLALQMHPDKNKAPGSAEAFKAVGNAVAVLTDPEKRKQYDLYGNEEVSRGHSHSSYTRGFESDATAEELFHMFFGSGFNGSNVYVRRGGRWQRQTTGSQRGQHATEEQSSYSALLQLLPIIIAILLSVASGLFVSDPVYSLAANNKYPVMRRTGNLQVPYYVKENFHTEFQGSVRRLEMSVEEEYVSNLRHACYREKNYKESMMWKARNFGDHDMFRNAQNMKTPACDQLNQLSKKGIS